MEQVYDVFDAMSYIGGLVSFISVMLVLIAFGIASRNKEQE